uniref:Uncharacterized protein n=1 Tax=Bactrocera dorsalis TaxID=27457 RepID=A0A034WL37_BACDO
MENINQTIAELERVISRQEELLQTQQQEMQQQHAQHLLQLQMNQQPQFYKFHMSPRDIMDQFRRMKPLDDHHNPKAFIKAVETNISLCGTDQELIQHCINIIANEKILGTAGKRTRELEDNSSWEAIKAKILQGSRPRKTYAEVFNFCRTVKVSNLNELFIIFEKCKAEINEIYIFDPLKPGIYKPENVDRDLVDILLEKIDGPIRAHITETETLNDIIVKYSKLKLLQDKRAIDYRHRKYVDKNKANYEGFKKSYRSYENNKISDNRQTKPTNDNRQQSGNNNNYIRNTNFNRNNYNNRNNYDYGYNNSSNKIQANLPRQTKSSHMSVDYNPSSSRLSNNSNLMEIGNGEEKEVNFLTPPQTLNSP